MISAGEDLPSRRAVHMEACVLGGAIRLRVRVLEPLSAHHRVIQATADDAQLRPCSPGHSVPGTAGPCHASAVGVPRLLSSYSGARPSMAIRTRAAVQPRAAQDQDRLPAIAEP